MSDTNSSTAETSISSRIGKDIIAAMKARDEHRLTTLRMVKSALKSKEIDKRQPLDDAEESQILTTLIKQRRESIESFTKGDRPELAEKERVELAMIESYLPQAATEEEIRAIVQGALAYLAEAPGGSKLGPKDMGPAMRVIKQRLLADGIRADGQLVSNLVKEELAK
ncbi:GatB/YqeY domain-containing protein [Granulicella sp. WH15]|uniref:GatB/YqeY domain-containing protein n=1 Tax=Granulicella sp. WH15 TaxID=2602070 RepID=UPI00136682E4|nr:GatB/YqeY domain-containing protein [Granulicella sp. WH15]QHN04645.1 GatB/YqeY domain-containing protein [Granulicella sp. WH15]